MENNGNIVKPRYILVDNQKVFLNPEQQKAWDKFINDVRNRARREGSCGQPNYHLCFGDCETCPHRIQGKVLSSDDERYGDGYAAGKNRVLYQPKSPEEIVIGGETQRDIYTAAARLVKNGDRILRLSTVDGLSTYEIGKELGMPQTTVNKYLKKVLAFLREHRAEFIDY